MEEYRIDLKVRNNVILRKIEGSGYATVGEFCRVNEITKYTSSLGSIIAMKESPLTKKGDFKKVIIDVAELLECAPYDLFTETQFHIILKTNKRSLQVNEAEMKFMLQNQNEQKLLDSVIEQDQLEKFTDKTLDKLRPREKKVIQMRFGLGEYTYSHTLEEIGNEIGTQRERVRQIETKALRKLRHPSINSELKDFYDDNES